MSVNSIVWANDLNPNAPLKVGQSIRIPPTSGVVYVVESKDTVASIAAKFKVPVEKIATQNAIAANTGLEIGQTLIIPGGVRLPVAKKEDSKKPAVAAKKPASTLTAKKPSSTIAPATSGRTYAVRYTGNSRGFAWGNCTYYVAMHKKVTWR